MIKGLGSSRTPCRDDAFCDEGGKDKKKALKRAFMGALKYSLSENGRLLECV